MAKRIFKGKRGKGVLGVVALLIVLAALFGGQGAPDVSGADPADLSAPAPAAEAPTESDDALSQAEPQEPAPDPEPAPPAAASFDVSQVPAFSGAPYVDIAQGAPAFTDADLALPYGYESYSPLDSLGRCGTAVAVVGAETMPTAERGDIGDVRPSGWHTVRYNGLVDGNYLYNRCHLIGYQLSGENANEQNLITGTRFMNVEGMLPFENEVDDYVERTGNHVLYRATPVFEGNELVARGVQLEARSVEDGGAGVSFNVFCYNVQPGVGIDYATGDSWAEQATASSEPAADTTYVLNTNSMKFHYPDCGSVDQMSPKNRRDFTGTRDEAIAQGYTPCGNCKP